MDSKQKAIIQDMAAYLAWCLANNEDWWVVLTTLVHDTSGLVLEKRCFLPRVTGYREHVDAVRALYHTLENL